MTQNDEVERKVEKEDQGSSGPKKWEVKHWERSQGVRKSARLEEMKQNANK